MRILNLAKERPKENYVYIGRPSVYGNPFVIGRHGDRDAVILKYIIWVWQHPEVLEAISKLRGKDLACFCSPEKCHGDVLKALAESTVTGTSRAPEIPAKGFSLMTTLNGGIVEYKNYEHRFKFDDKGRISGGEYTLISTSVSSPMYDLISRLVDLDL